MTHASVVYELLVLL